jgi:hypothetical protein
LLFTDRENGSPDAEALRGVVATVVRAVLADSRHAPARVAPLAST